MPSLTAVVGAATAAYSAALIAFPPVLLRPGGLEDSRDTRTLVRALAVRDSLIAAAMIAAPPGRDRRVATAARVLADCGDAAAFGAGLAGRPTRGLVAASAAAWAALSLLAGVLDERAGR